MKLPDQLSVLGEAEGCCGDPAGGGYEISFDSTAAQNIEAFKGHGVRRSLLPAHTVTPP